MTTRLPTPPREYDMRDQDALRKAVERILDTLYVSTNELGSSINTGSLAGYITADVTNGTADLTINLTGAAAAFPAQVRVYEGTVDSVAIYDDTAVAAGSITGGALNARALPLRELEKWFLRLTGPDAVDHWFGPTSADRNAVPNGAVTAIPGGELKCEYDDDTDSVVVTTPTGTKTFSGLTGGGTLSYVAGTTAHDDASLEAALALDEVRDGYTVEYIGGGETRVFFTGALTGLNHDYAVPQLDVKVTPYDDRYDFEYTQTAGDVYKRITSDSGGDTGFVSILTGTALTFSVFRSATEDQTVQLRGVLSNAQDTVRTFTVPTSNPLSGVTFTLDAVTADDTANTVTVAFTLSGEPLGWSVNLVWSVDGGANGSVAGISTPYVISTPVGATPSGMVTVYLVDGDAGVVTSIQSIGAFAI